MFLNSKKSFRENSQSWTPISKNMESKNSIKIEYQTANNTSKMRVSSEGILI